MDICANNRPGTDDKVGVHVSITMMTARLIQAPRMKMGTLPVIFMMEANPTDPRASHTPNTIRSRPTV